METHPLLSRLHTLSYLLSLHLSHSPWLMFDLRSFQASWIVVVHLLFLQSHYKYFNKYRIKTQWSSRYEGRMISPTNISRESKYKTWQYKTIKTQAQEESTMNFAHSLSGIFFRVSLCSLGWPNIIFLVRDGYGFTFLPPAPKYWR